MKKIFRILSPFKTLLSVTENSHANAFFAFFSYSLISLITLDALMLAKLSDNIFSVKKKLNTKFENELSMFIILSIFSEVFQTYKYVLCFCAFLMFDFVMYSVCGVLWFN